MLPVIILGGAIIGACIIPLSGAALGVTAIGPVAGGAFAAM